jgi:DNA invertase Pin-like site-specific DNA recombinase
MNTVIFARGKDIKGQVKKCREYAEAMGYSVEAVVVGQGNQLADIIKGLDTDIDKVIVSCMSRISRNALEGYTIQAELEIDYGVTVEVAKDNISDDVADRFMLNVMKVIHQDQQRAKERQEKIFELKLRGIIE